MKIVRVHKVIVRWGFIIEIDIELTGHWCEWERRGGRREASGGRSLTLITLPELFFFTLDRCVFLFTVRSHHTILYGCLTFLVNGIADVVYHVINLTNFNPLFIHYRLSTEIDVKIYKQRD